MKYVIVHPITFTDPATRKPVKKVEAFPAHGKESIDSNGRKYIRLLSGQVLRV